MSTVHIIPYSEPYQIKKNQKWGGGLLSYKNYVFENSSMFSIDNDRTLCLLHSNGQTQSLFQLADTVDTIPITLDNFEGDTNWDGSCPGNIIKRNSLECFNMCLGTGNEVRIILDNCPNDVVDVVGLHYSIGNDHYTYNMYVTLEWYNESKQIGITTNGYYYDSTLSIYMLAGNPSKVRYRIAPSMSIYTYASWEPTTPIIKNELADDSVI